MIDAILNITIILLITILLILIKINNSSCVKGDDTEIQYADYKLKKRNSEKCKNIPLDYNHVKQRNVRRDIDFIQTEREIKRKQIENKYKDLAVERNNQIVVETETEIINSLDKEIVKLITEYKMIKKGIVQLNIESDISKKYKYVQQLLNKIEEKKENAKMIQNIEFKLNVIKEYLMLLENIQS